MRTSQQTMAKAIAIKTYERKSGRSAKKVVKLTVGDLQCCSKELRLSRGCLIAWQKSAEDIVGDPTE